jgi:hypothetical protein
MTSQPAKKNPRQVRVQPQEPKPEKGAPQVPAPEEDEQPRRGFGEGNDQRSNKDRDGLGR